MEANHTKKNTYLLTAYFLYRFSFLRYLFFMSYYEEMALSILMRNCYALRLLYRIFATLDLFIPNMYINPKLRKIFIFV